MLERTIRGKELARIHLLRAALTDRSGKAPFFVDGVSGARGTLESDLLHRTGTIQNSYQLSGSIEVDAISLDCLIRDGFPGPDLMKLDIEGSEHKALAGGWGYVCENHPKVIIETGREDLLARLGSIGYAYAELASGNVLLVPRNRVAREKELWQTCGFAE